MKGAVRWRQIKHHNDIHGETLLIFHNSIKTLTGTSKHLNTNTTPYDTNDVSLSLFIHSFIHIINLFIRFTNDYDASCAGPEIQIKLTIYSQLSSPTDVNDFMSPSFLQKFSISKFAHWATYLALEPLSHWSPVNFLLPKTTGTLKLNFSFVLKHYFDGLVQDCSNSIVNCASVTAVLH